MRCFVVPAALEVSYTSIWAVSLHKYEEWARTSRGEVTSSGVLDCSRNLLTTSASADLEDTEWLSIISNVRTNGSGHEIA